MIRQKTSDGLQVSTLFRVENDDHLGRLFPDRLLELFRVFDVSAMDRDAGLSEQGIDYRNIFRATTESNDWYAYRFPQDLDPLNSMILINWTATPLSC